MCSFFPIFLVPVVAFLILMFWRLYRDPHGVLGKSLVLLFLAVGCVILGFVPSGTAQDFVMLLVCGPLISQSLALLFWNTFRAKGRVAGTIYGFLAAFLGLATLFYFIEPKVLEVPQIVALYSFFLFMPIAGMRIAFQNKVTLRRGLWAYALSSILPGAVLVPVILTQSGGRGWVVFPFVAYFLLSSLPLLALTVWNRWAQDVITGRKFRNEEASGSE